MKIKKVLSFLLTMAMMVSLFAGMTTFTALADDVEYVVVDTLYSNDFEGDASVGSASNILTKVTGNSGTVVGAPSASDPARLGSKYVITGRTPTADSVGTDINNTSAPLRYRATFNKSANSGIINLEMDVCLLDNAEQCAGDWAYVGFAKDVGSVGRLIGLWRGNVYIGQAAATVGSMTIGQWSHISMYYDISTKTVSVSLDGAAPVTATFDSAVSSYSELWIRNMSATDYAFDNIVVNTVEVASNDPEPEPEQPQGEVIYSQNFEGDATVGSASNVLTKVTGNSGAVVGAPSASDPKRLGSKYVITGRTSTVDSVGTDINNSSAPLRYRLNFDKPVTSGTINLEMDVCLIDNNEQCGGDWVYAGFAKDVGAVGRIIGLWRDNAYIGQGTAHVGSIPIGQWSHISMNYDIATKTATMKVNDGTPVTTTFDSAVTSYSELWIRNMYATDFAFDNIVVRHIPLVFSATPSVTTTGTVTAGDTVNGVVSISAAAEAKTINGYIAAYDASKNLIAAQYYTKNLSSTDTGANDLELTLTIPAGYQGTVKYLKAFAWDEDMLPYADAEMVEVNN